MIELLLGHNHINLGYIGVASATIGLLVCLIVILPQALKEATKVDSLRNTRLSLAALVFVIFFQFGNAYLIEIVRIMRDGFVGSVEGNHGRFFYGTGIGVLGVLLYIIYKKGGRLPE